MVAIGVMVLTIAGLYHDRTVEADLFLEAGVTVVPISAGLRYRESVLESLTRRDSRKTDSRHAVHMGRQDNAVPVNGRRCGQSVRDPDGHSVTLPPPQ